ncbi:hypothetical protein OG535_20310 [Kitasatospora sp. NBC_00085]|uniref:WXG100-like domain-containing protein n=1 Tax=unclassified Kitasatospora TaxID=2633591 RepID=UPI003246E59A
MGESAAAKIVRKTTGMWWPDADPGKLRKAAAAWDAMATAIDNVTAPTSQAAAALIENNHGPAMDAFATFWHRYYEGGKGWLPDSAKACRNLAEALRKFADEVDKAVKKLEEEAAIVGASLVAGTALAFFTAGLSEAAAGVATAGVIAAAEALGVAVSETIAAIAGTVLTGVVFGAVEAVTVDLAVAQPIRVSFGDGGYSLTEALSAAETGGVMGGAGSGLGAGGRVVATAAESADSASVALAAAGKLAAAADTIPGRMVTGAALTAGAGEVFQTGPVMPLDLVLGAVGGAAAPTGGGPKRRGGFTGAEADGWPGGGGSKPEPWISESGAPYAVAPGQEPEIKAVKIYEKFRGTTDDVPEVAEAIGVDPKVVQVAKDNLMVKRHDVPVGAGEENVIKDVHFEPDWEIARRWNAAVGGFMKPDGGPILRSVMAHEYVEAKLLEAGLPYLPSHPDAWRGSEPQFHADHVGAHTLAPRAFDTAEISAEGTLRLWKDFGIDVPPAPIADDLSNLDILVDAVKSHLRAKGYDLK